MAKKPTQPIVHCVMCHQDKVTQHEYTDLTDPWCQACLVAERQRWVKDDMIAVGRARRPPRYILDQSLWPLMGY